jgi:hypothetical protein
MSSPGKISPNERAVFEYKISNLSFALEIARAGRQAAMESYSKLKKTHDRLLAQFHDLEINAGLRDDESGPSSPGPRCVYCCQTRAGTPDSPHLQLRNIWVCGPCNRAETL